MCHALKQVGTACRGAGQAAGGGGQSMHPCGSCCGRTAGGRAGMQQPTAAPQRLRKQPAKAMMMT
jgi:hypothetical protein